MAATLDTHGRVTTEHVLKVLEVGNMFDAYRVVSRWKEELAELRKLRNGEVKVGNY